MNILIVIDKIPSAICNLAEPIRKYLDHHNVIIFPVHPKRCPMDTLFEAQKLMRWADIIDIHYWKSGEVLKSTFPTEWEAKPKICFHMNPYDTDKSDWKDYLINVVGNQDIQLKIGGSHLVPYGIDLDFFEFNEDYTNDKTVMMSVARIEGKKGVYEVAKVCEELGYKFILVGRVSEPKYLNSIGPFKCLEFIENATQETLKESYYRSAIHVCNSVDNFESGTLPILEAMACGVPVLTRNVGHVPDIADGTNMVVRSGQPDDLNDLKNNLVEMMENKPMRERIREGGWKTARSRSDKIMVRQVDKLYYQMVSNDKRWVSVILPTFDRPEPLVKSLTSLIGQDYPNIEMVVADSGNMPVENIITEARKHTHRPIKYIRFDNKGEYTLPKARNLAVLKAIGEVLVFCDDRIVPEYNAITEFEKNAMRNTWLWGVKDDAVKGFVENFSCVLRDGFIEHGMCNERIDCYGGQTQELRTRFEKNQFMFTLIKEAKAVGSVKSGKAKHRKDIIKSKSILQEMYA